MEYDGKEEQEQIDFWHHSMHSLEMNQEDVEAKKGESG